MKLAKLKINNFRGLKGENNEIDFSGSDIIFLIGQNNVGKSTYLRAYEFFVAPKQVAKREDFYNHSSDNPIVIEGWFIKEDGDENDTELQGKAKDADWLTKWVGADGYIKVKKEWKSVDGGFEKYTFSPTENDWVLNGLGGMDTIFTKHAPTPIAIGAMEDQASLEEKVNKLIQDDFIKKIRESHANEYNSLIESVKKLQSQITGSESVENLNRELNEHFQKVFADLTLKIQASKDENIKIENAFQKNHSVIVERKDNSRKETFLQNGHGVIRQALFNFLTFLKRNTATSKKQYLILFEEPEAFLHPKVAFKLRESLYGLAENSPYQILCATHSPLMIDISKPHTSLVRVVKDGAETTTTYQVGENVFGGDEHKRQWVQMVNRFNPHICEAFYADKVLLVEGDTETIVYRDLLARLYPHEEIFVLNTGSKTNMQFFQHILTAFEIEHYVIHDSDSRVASDGRRNPAWSQNESIWQFVAKANEKKAGLARRYVHEGNFEKANDVQMDAGNRDKPFNAYMFAVSLTEDSDAPCLRWLKDIIGPKTILHDDEYVETLDRQCETA